MYIKALIDGLSTMYRENRLADKKYSRAWAFVFWSMKDHKTVYIPLGGERIMGELWWSMGTLVESIDKSGGIVVELYNS